jgi:hypothetical protein
MAYGVICLLLIFVVYQRKEARRKTNELNLLLLLEKEANARITKLASERRHILADRDRELFLAAQKFSELQAKLKELIE